MKVDWFSSSVIVSSPRMMRAPRDHHPVPGAAGENGTGKPGHQITACVSSSSTT
jgi:hypothetical protein